VKPTLITAVNKLFGELFNNFLVKWLVQVRSAIVVKPVSNVPCDDLFYIPRWHL
jgi:hypothetical protein